MEHKKILVIDDDVDMVTMLRIVLTREGYEVVTAYNGQEGLECLKTHNPHLIVLDMNMPRMGGIEFYHAIYDQKQEKSKYPVLILTARANLEQLFRDLDVDGFMAKPYDIPQLLKEISIIISRRYHEIDKLEVPNEPREQKKILIIEDDEVFYNKLSIMLLNAGFIVNAAKTAVSGIERAMTGQPDLILIKLGIKDFPGDLACSRLKHMPKTMHIPLILYTAPTGKTDGVMKLLCEKVGIRSYIETNDPLDLLKECSEILSKM